MDDHRPASDPTAAPPTLPTAPPTAPPASPPPVRTAPPTEPGDIAPPSPAWPTVLGVLAIVFGALGTISTLLAFPVVILAENLSPSSPALYASRWIVTVLALPLAIWHLYAGVFMVRRRRSGPVQLISWAIADIVYIIATGVITSLGSFTATPTAFSPFAMVSAGSVWFGTVLSMAWPVTAIILLMLPSYRKHWKLWR